MASVTRQLLRPSSKLMTSAPLFSSSRWLSTTVASRAQAQAQEAASETKPKSSSSDGFELVLKGEVAKKTCTVCEYRDAIDYKNVRLLSQFVSPQTGQILRRSTTGVCSKMQRKISRAIKRARQFGLMPYIMKHHLYERDPTMMVSPPPKK